VGYAALTMDDIAVTAGVSKASIYRRWATKGDLLVSVVDRASLDMLEVPDGGCLRADLVFLIRCLADVLAGPGGQASRALLGAATHDHALADAFHRGPQERWSQAFRAVFARAVSRGELDPMAGTSRGAEAGPGILLLRWLVSGAPIDHELAEAVVEEVMLPLLRQYRPHP
jgi:AcrR family transcriptional regulator